jgi:hypothetical protein
VDEVLDFFSYQARLHWNGEVSQAPRNANVPSFCASDKAWDTYLQRI